MLRRLPLMCAFRRPLLASMLLATTCAGARAGDAVPTHAPIGKVPPQSDANLTLGTPVAPVATPKGDVGVGLRSLDANGATFVALRTDGRVLVVTAGVERVVEPPENGESFRPPIVAGDATSIAVTTRGRIALLEAEGTRFLPLSVQRSAKPAAIPNSADVVLASENGSIRRLVRSGASERLVDILGPGDEPVGALAVSSTRVAYARLDGELLDVAIGGGEPRVLAHPVRAVHALRFVGDRLFAAIGGTFFEFEESPSRSRPTYADASDHPDVESAAVTSDGSLVALLCAGAIEVRRLADGTRVRSEALVARQPTAIAWSADSRVLLVATATDARPFTIPVDPGITAGARDAARTAPR